MKINKDLIQKALLGTMLGVGCLYYYFAELLGPLSTREVKATKEMANLEPQIQKAKTNINRSNAIESGDSNAAAARKAYEVMQAKIPTGDPIAWFPTKLTEFFRRQGIPKQSYRCNPETMEQIFPGYKVSSWVVELPSVDFASLGNSMAELENQEGLIQIENIQIDAAGKEPESHHAQLVISTLVKSEK